MAKDHLPNAPLVEVSCEIRFHGDLSLYQTWGHFQKKVRTDFPKLFVPAAAVGVSPLIQPLKLASQDGMESVLLAINSFAFSTQQYETFSKFRSSLLDLQAVFFGLLKLSEITRFGLRYVNILPPACEDGASGRRLHPCLSLEISGLDGSWANQPQLVAEKRAGRCNLRTALVSLRTPGRPPTLGMSADSPVLSPGIQLDLDCYRDEACSVEDIPALLDEAHGTIETAFFGMITQEYLGYLKGT